LDKAIDQNREVQPEEGRALADAHGARFCEASAKTRDNVRRPFVDIVDQIVQSPALLSGGKAARRNSSTIVVNGNGSGEGYLSGCSC